MTFSCGLEEVRVRLEEQFCPLKLKVGDESLNHVGHSGASSSAGHYSVMIVSDFFSGKSKIERHRMVYNCLSDLMSVRIHALRIRALSPDECELNNL